MNISYDAYKVFCAVASLGSITGAAEKLYISQPAVSQSHPAVGGSARLRAVCP